MCVFYITNFTVKCKPSNEKNKINRILTIIKDKKHHIKTGKDLNHHLIHHLILHTFF